MSGVLRRKNVRDGCGHVHDDRKEPWRRICGAAGAERLGSTLNKLERVDSAESAPCLRLVGPDYWWWRGILVGQRGYLWHSHKTWPETFVATRCPQAPRNQAGRGVHQAGNQAGRGQRDRTAEITPHSLG